MSTPPLPADLLASVRDVLEEAFIASVCRDLQAFLAAPSSSRRSLAFPPVDNRRRYLIHRIGDAYACRTVSVGQGLSRFTVVVAGAEGDDAARLLSTAMEPQKSKKPGRSYAALYVPPPARRTKGSNIVCANDGANETTPTDTSPRNPPVPEASVINNIKQVASESNAAAPSEKSRDGELTSWEDMFDENGHLTDKDLAFELALSGEQLEQQIGSLCLERAKEDYADFAPSAEKELAHILELYDFPGEFKTCDLMAIFDAYQATGFSIKWVDDTHALAIFPSATAASGVLSLKHPLVKLRPVASGTPASCMKARKFPLSAVPLGPRPQTCPQAARRLVSGALGLKLNNAKQDREEERRILKEAREKKRLAAKQQDDAWEGRPFSQQD